MSLKAPLNSYDNHLEIIIREDGISYLILNKENKVLLSQEINIPTEKSESGLIDFFFNQPELQIFNKNVTIIFDNTTYTLFPNEFFRLEDYQSIFELEHGKKEKSTYTYDLIRKWGVHFVFRISDKINSFFEEKYPQAKIKHKIAELLKEKVHKKDGVYVLYNNDITTIVVVKNNELQLTTSFHTPHLEDSGYFVLSVYEELDCDKEKYPLYIIYVKQQAKALQSLLNKHICNIKIIK